MFRYLYLKETTSTNDIAKELGKKGENNLAIIADAQTKGRGRMSRSFCSRRGNGLYMSLLFQAQDPLLVPVIAALSVHQVVAKYSRSPVSIKWPNDILIESAGSCKKICGILCESFFRGTEQYTVCGIGLNLLDDFSPELKEIATCLKEHGNYPGTARELGKEIGDHFSALLQQEKPELITKYKSHLRNLYREIQVLKGQESLTGTCIDLNEKGELLVRTKEGETITIHSGEVSIREIT